MTESALVSALKKSGAVLHGEFTLSSGETSDYYIDKYAFETNPEALDSVGNAITDELRDLPVEKIGGVALGAVPLAAVASVKSGIPYVIARKEGKDYGTGNLVEGELHEGERVVVIEDVVTTGKSVLEAVQKLRDAGAVVEHVVVVVDREEGGRNNIEEEGVELHALLTADQLLGEDP